jgi:cold shock CspA family protein
MRKHGTLTRWKDDRGFGFITPASGPPDLFVHISAFPRDGRRPQLNELISFEVEAGPDGRMRAVRLMRTGQARQRVLAPSVRQPRQGWLGGAFAGLVIAGAGIYGYFHFTHQQPAIEATAPTLPRYEEVQPQYSCDGRTMCPQMTSCAEATYFIRNCPDTKMDGDNDGVPCEDQWCN